MAVRTIPVTLHIEEGHFFQRMRDFDDMEGVAKSEANLEVAMSSKKRVNGANGAHNRKVTLKQFILALLAREGAAPAKVIKQAAMDYGFKASGISGQLTSMKSEKPPLVEKAGLGFWRLTKKVAEEMSAQEQPAPLALPAPTTLPKGASGRPSGMFLLMSTMKAAGNEPVLRATFIQTFEAAGLAGESTVRNVISRAVKDGLISYTDTKGQYKITPKGKKYELQQEGNEA